MALPRKSFVFVWDHLVVSSRFREFTELLKRPGWNMLVKHHSGAKRKESFRLGMVFLSRPDVPVV